MYFAGGKQYDENSATNQRIIDLFIGREVRCCMTDIVEYILDTGTASNCPPFDWDSIEYQNDIECPKCGSHGIEEIILEAGMMTPDYIDEADPEEQWICPVCGAGYQTSEEAMECCVGEIAYRCQDCGNIMTSEEMDELEQADNKDILEWWAVSDWFCDKLAKHGEPIIKSAGLWGRTTSGQSISSDAVVSDICRELGILEGQAHEWKVA